MKTKNTVETSTLTPSNVETLSTGCKRQKTDGRGSYELITPFAHERVAKLYEWGAHDDHRGNRNWEKGCPFSRCIQSIERHITKIKMREPDEEHDDNLAAIVFWANAMMHYQEMIKRGRLPAELDDMPHYTVLENLTSHAVENMVSRCIAGIENDSANSVDDSTTNTMSCCECLDSTHTRSGRPIVHKPLRIFVSGPISCGDVVNRQMEHDNCELASLTGAKIENLGHETFVPHRYQTWREDCVSMTYERLLAFDMGIIERWADCLYFIGSSHGADGEYNRARALGLTIFKHIDEVPIVCDGMDN